MEAPSIITQVLRDDEHLGIPPVADRENLSIKKPKKSIFRTLFCCCFGVENETSSPGTNGVCLPEDINYRCRVWAPPHESTGHLLPPLCHQDMHKKCMVIDLDETLVHSSFRYADPVADLLDKWGVFRARLFRESCVFHRGNYVKDLGCLGRDIHKVVILDNSPASYIFHPDNAIPVSSWFDDMSDSQLVDLIPLLESISKVDSVYSVLRDLNNSVNQTPVLSSNHVNSVHIPPPSLSPTSLGSPITQVQPSSIQQPNNCDLLQQPLEQTS